MLKHRASEGPAELQLGSTFVQETPSVRQSYYCVSLQRRRLSAICKTHNVYCSPLSMTGPRDLSFSLAGRVYQQAEAHRLKYIEMKKYILEDTFAGTGSL